MASHKLKARRKSHGEAVEGLAFTDSKSHQNILILDNMSYLFFRERERKEREKRGREKGRKEERREGPPLGDVQSTKVDLIK